MRKSLFFVSLAIVIAFLGLMYGCAQTTETTTTSTTSSTTTTTTTAEGTTTTTASGTTTTTTSTTTTTNPLTESAGQAAGKSASLSTGALLGISNVAIAAGNISGISGNPSQFQSSSVKASDVNAFTIPVPPPSSFLSSREASWDGYLSVPSIHAGETVSIRFSTVGGTVIDGALLTASPQKQIAQFQLINWINFLTPEAISQSTWLSDMTAWVMSQSYRNIYSMWDYIMWSSVAGQVHSYAETFHSPLAVFSTPESTIPTDMLGSFQGTVSREVSQSNYGVALSFLGTMEYNISITPAHEVPKILSGGGTITLPDSTAVALTMNLGFVTNEAQGTIPTTGTMHWSFTGYDATWEGTVTLSYSSSAILGSGNVIKNGTDVGTLFLNSTGGAIVTVEGQTINVTAPQ